MLRMAPPAVFLIAVAVFLAAALSSPCKSDEFPIYVFMDTYSLDTGKVDIDTAYSQMVELGVTHFYGWTTAETVEKAAEYGLKIVAANEVNSGYLTGSGSDSLRKNWFDISNLSDLKFEHAVRKSLLLDLEIEHFNFLEGYAFEIDGLVGQSFEIGEPPDVIEGYACLVDQHQEGYLFDGLAWGELHNEKSCFAEMTHDTATVNCTAEFYMKVPTPVDDTIKVCRIEIWEGKNDSLLSADTIYGSQFTQTDTFQVVQLDFPQVWFKGNKKNRVRLMPSLYWFDQVDLYVDRLRVYNPKGDTILINTEEDTMLTRLEDYFDGLGGDISSVHSYYFVEPIGGSVPTHKKFTDLLIQASAPDAVPSLADIGTWSYQKIITEVYTNIVDPPVVVPYNYWYRCGMDLATDTCINGWRYQPSDCWNIQYPLRVFIAALDSTYQKTKRIDPDKEFWMILQSTRTQGKVEDSTGYYYWGMQDPTREVFRVGVYLSLAHGAKGLGFYTYGTYDFRLTPSSEPCEPISYEEWLADNPGEREPEGEIPEECIHEGYLPVTGLVDYDPDSCNFVLNEKWYMLKDILDRAKPMGSILRECELVDVGLIDSQTVGVGYVDSVIGEYESNWIEVATFAHNTTGDDYFMLVNRRLLPDEVCTATVYFNPDQLPLGPMNYFVIDMSTEVQDTVYSDSNYIFRTIMQPGEGYLYRLVGYGVSGYQSGTWSGAPFQEEIPIAGDIVVDSNDTLTITQKNLLFLPQDLKNYGVDEQRSEIIVKGLLVLNWTTSLESATGEIGSWYGIRVVDNGQLVIGSPEGVTIRGAYIGVSLEDPTTSLICTLGVVEDYHTVIDSCEVGGMYLSSDSVVFINGEDMYDSLGTYCDSLVIKNVPNGYGIKVVGENDFDFKHMVSIEDCKYGIYAGTVDGKVKSIKLRCDIDSCLYGVYHLAGSVSNTLDLRYVYVEGNFNSGVYVTGKSRLSVVDCLINSRGYDMGVGITSTSMGSLTMRQTEIKEAAIGIWVANANANYGEQTDSGCNIIEIDTSEAESRCVYYNGFGTLKAYNNYWGQWPVPDTSKFEEVVGTIGYIPALDERPPMNWGCTDTIGGGYSCYQDPVPPGAEKIAADDDAEEQLPLKYSLSHSYPNPMNPSCTIEYSLEKASHVEISIYNILGRKVKTLVNHFRPAGPDRVVWDGRNDQGDYVASGVYFYKMKAGDYTDVKKMVVLK